MRGLKVMAKAPIMHTTQTEIIFLKKIKLYELLTEFLGDFYEENGIGANYMILIMLGQIWEWSVSFFLSAIMQII